DFDNDGNLDLVVANGHPDDQIEASHTGLKWKEPLLLLENRNGKFVNRSADGGEAFRQEYPARGLAIGDLDNDGWPDVVVANNGAAPLVLHHSGGRNHWIGLNGVPPGATLRWPGGVRLVTAGGSYLSSQDPRVVIGLGSAAKLEWLQIEWPAPGKRTLRLTNPLIDRYHSVGSGKPSRWAGSPVKSCECSAC